MKKKVDFQKGSGEFIAFSSVALFICILVVMMCAYIQLTVYTQKLTNAVSVCGRSVSICTSLDDAKTQALRVAESSMSGISNIDGIEVEVEYATSDRTWTSGNFLKVTVSAVFHTVAPYIDTKKHSKSTIVCIENLAITGPVIDIPAGMGVQYTVTEYDKFYPRWTSGTRQRKVADLWYNEGAKWDDGIAILQDCYLVATTETFGVVGDRINVVLDNGLTMKCIIADSKNSSDPGCNAYGHDDGKSTIEFEVKSSYYLAHGNPATNGWHMEMKGKVTRIINLGTSVLN